MKPMHLLTLASLLSVLLGCASPRIIPMTEGAASKIKSTEAILVLSQQEIAAEINPSGVAAAGGGGLLLALVLRRSPLMRRINSRMLKGLVT